MEEKIYKISFIGDIMCEPPLLQQLEKDNYDFYPVFKGLGTFFDTSDYVVGNLETPLAGEKAGYSDTLMSFNTPDQIVDALKKTGVKMMTTANNHCLDRGTAGLFRTLDVLDEKKIEHTGTFRPEEKQHYLIKQFGQTKVAFVSSTYGTNYPNNKVMPLEKDGKCVELMRDITDKFLSPKLPKAFYDEKAKLEAELGRKIKSDESIKLRRDMGIRVDYADDNFEYEYTKNNLEKMLYPLLKEAKENSDLLIFLPHTGGQFNTEPGSFSKLVIDTALSNGCDAVLAAHSHTTQKYENIDGIPVFYSIGNVTMMPGTCYSVAESLPEYGLVVHIYICNGKIIKKGFSIFKITGNVEEKVAVIPTHELFMKLTGEEKIRLERETGEIYTRVCGKKLKKIEKEYEL